MPQHEGRERVRVGARPDAVGVVVWVRCDRVLDPLDERIHAGAAHVGQKIGRAAEPPAIRGALADGDRAASAANAKACHLIHGERRSVSRLGRNPRMYAEVAAPSDRARRIHLHHPLWSDRGIRRPSDRRAAGAAPVADRVGSDRRGRVPAGAAAGAAAATSRVGACFTISRDGRDDKSPSALMRTCCRSPSALTCITSGARDCLVSKQRVSRENGASRCSTASSVRTPDHHPRLRV